MSGPDAIPGLRASDHGPAHFSVDATNAPKLRLSRTGAAFSGPTITDRRTRDIAVTDPDGTLHYRGADA